MAKQSQSNPCIRCGKQRVVIETYEELAGNSVIKITNMACPDKECQSILDEKFEYERSQREALQRSKEIENRLRLKRKSANS